MQDQSVENILRAQVAVEEKTGHVLDAGAVPVVIRENSPCGFYAFAKSILERIEVYVGCVSLETHWDVRPLDHLTGNPRVARSASWKYKVYEKHNNIYPRHLLGIGERCMLERKELVKNYLLQGFRFISTWKLRTSLGIDGLVSGLDRFYDETKGMYAHFDMEM